MSPGPVRAFAPGRVNLIGEHTDYNAGLCLPFAIERGRDRLGGADRRHRDRGPRARSLPAGQLRARTRDRPPHPGRAGAPTGWRRFVRGAVAELLREGIELRPCRVEITPRRAARRRAVVVRGPVGRALPRPLRGRGLEPPGPRALARLCSRVERDWCGADAGLLDQLASLLGRRGSRASRHARPQRRPVDLPLGRSRDGHLGRTRSLAARGTASAAPGAAAPRALGVRFVTSRRPAPCATSRTARPPGRQCSPKRARGCRRRGAAGRRPRRARRAARRLPPQPARRLRGLVGPEVRAIRACRSRRARRTAVGGSFGGSVLALLPPEQPTLREGPRGRAGRAGLPHGCHI